MLRPHHAAVLLAAVALGGAGACSGHPAADPNAPWPVDPKTGLRVSEQGPVPALPAWTGDATPTGAKATLGKQLFSDARLSGSGKMACANCHFPNGDFESGGPKDAPDRSYPAVTPTLRRNTPSLYNYVYATMARWDGSYFTDVFDVAILPLAEANLNAAAELPASDVDGVDEPQAQAALYKTLTVTAPGYAQAFQGAFGKDIMTLAAADVWRLAGEAIAVYLRGAVSRDSAYDRWNAGDANAMTPAAIRGLGVFRGAGRCSVCHAGPMFTDYQFHNVGTSPPGPDGTRPDEGRYDVTHVDADHGAFLTPTLRSAAMTSPYFHDGSEVSLTSVIRRKATASSRNLDPAHDPLLDTISLSDQDIADLVAFLEALTGAPVPASVTAPPAQLP